MRDRLFDYAVPERARQDVRVGTRVRVGFHGRRVGGWVARVGTTPPEGVEVRELATVSGWGPPDAVLGLADWAAWRWAMPVATVLRSASPPRNVWSLPEAPPARGTGGAEAATTLERRPPAEDLLPLVVDAAERAAGPVLVLVPSAGWAERLSARLRRRGFDVAADWAQARAGWPVVVGSRAASWAPLPRLGAAVVLDAHDYPGRYDAAVAVAERAARDGAPCTLVSPCPTAVQVAAHGPVRAAERSAERAGWAAVTVADRRGADPRTGLFSEELVGLARRVLPGRLLCVLNRTGRARLLACASCGSLARCATCGRPVGLDGTALRCPACGAERPAVCAACGATRLKVLRVGVSRAREELAALLGTGVGEVSAATGELPATPVLVGTEAVLHRVRHAEAVCFLDFDQHLLAPRFAAAEAALALVARASRVVGGRGATGHPGVLLQTRLPDHDVVRAAVAGDPGILTELAVRKEVRLPPFSALATVRAEGPPSLHGVEVSALGGDRWLVRAPDHRTLCDAVAVLGGGVRVDPDDV